eukprot:GFYU01001345.1.p1 GENE.GFYU01001345.1~~GFYU01001345.1.p1  ORF type:complete len:164 (+),score=26.96 GFYU01001345.1:68-493(+)
MDVKGLVFHLITSVAVTQSVLIWCFLDHNTLVKLYTALFVLLVGIEFTIASFMSKDRVKGTYFFSLNGIKRAMTKGDSVPLFYYHRIVAFDFCVLAWILWHGHTQAGPLAATPLLVRAIATLSHLHSPTALGLYAVYTWVL